MYENRIMKPVEIVLIGGGKEREDMEGMSLIKIYYVCICTFTHM
jgi:hypothetical protein